MGGWSQTGLGPVTPGYVGGEVCIRRVPSDHRPAGTGTDVGSFPSSTGETPTYVTYERGQSLSGSCSVTLDRLTLPDPSKASQ